MTHKREIDGVRAEISLTRDSSRYSSDSFATLLDVCVGGRERKGKESGRGAGGWEIFIILQNLAVQGRAAN